jgi:hypothetical protein
MAPERQTIEVNNGKKRHHIHLLHMNVMQLIAYIANERSRDLFASKGLAG